MRLAALGFLAALLTAPLAAQAAQAPASYRVRLVATAHTLVEYDKSWVQDGCAYHREGLAMRMVDLRSRRPTAIRVRVGQHGAAYVPALVRGIAVHHRWNGGRYLTDIRCRDNTGGEQKECGPLYATRRPRLASLAFNRTSSGGISWRKPALAELAAPVSPCGLPEVAMDAAWLDLVPGAVDEQALAGRALVRARGRASTRDQITEAGATIWRTRTVRWTLTFRRLS